MPARKITINGVSDSFKWQAGNTKRFIKFNTVTDVEYKEYCSMFDVYCGQNIVRVPNELREQFKAKYEEWKKTKMKKYKVGDTIYVKGTVGQIDKYDTSLPYCVDFENGTVWISSDNIIDELPTAEPVKPVLPKDVADEISFAKSIKGVTFDDYIVRELIRSDYKDSATNKMIKSSDIPNVIEVLLNAWNNGYTVEKEKKYIVYLDGLVTTDGAKQYLTKKDGKWFACRRMPGLHQEFTEDELKTAPELAQKLDRVEVKDDDSED